MVKDDFFGRLLPRGVQRMATLHFQAQVQADGTIRPPDDVQLAPGLVQVTLVTPGTFEPIDDSKHATGDKHLFQQLAELAQHADWSDAPVDLAENHDFYAHGAPKGLDSQ